MHVLKVLVYKKYMMFNLTSGKRNQEAHTSCNIQVLHVYKTLTITTMKFLYHVHPFFSLSLSFSKLSVHLNHKGLRERGKI